MICYADSPTEEGSENPLIDSKLGEQEEGLDSTCSSPEQETVRPKKSSLTCTRGPHVQDLFSRGSEAAPMSIIEPLPSSSKDEVLVSSKEVEPSKNIDKPV